MKLKIGFSQICKGNHYRLHLIRRDCIIGQCQLKVRIPPQRKAKQSRCTNSLEKLETRNPNLGQIHSKAGMPGAGVGRYRDLAEYPLISA